MNKKVRNTGTPGSKNATAGYGSKMPKPRGMQGVKGRDVSDHADLRRKAGLSK